MTDVKKLSNIELLEKLSKYRNMAFFSVLSIFLGMAVIIIYKVHFLYLAIVAVPFIFVARVFYKYYNEVQRRNLQ
ncbi:hypothetical protein [Mangrovibacterium marinum]|uniref:Uncharacterized protein n=1 Tax=Mangrovibacterium marinum TaxID=1639118 RepID=A0A2T5BXH7_9BACT|nr:hypothetical protein [Mangrovibacterium marinum]PTN05305.1 hypothetical protein C8N47_12727 [Mangrovibacterium marinum]